MREPLVLHHYLGIGDCLMLSAAIADLHSAWPGRYATDTRTPYPELFANNPHITPIPQSMMATHVAMNYPAYQQQDELGIHFSEAMTWFLAESLDIEIPSITRRPELYLSLAEKSARPLPFPYWLVISGGKNDVTIKWPDFYNLQRAIGLMLDRAFVQVGNTGTHGDLTHFQPKLEGDNVIGLRDRLNVRELIVYAYHAVGAICGVTALMHIMGAFQKPCVVLAGGREAPTWERYPQHVYFHSIGKLPCCQTRSCQRLRTVALNDGGGQDRHLCALPVQRPNGQWSPKCLADVTAEEIARAVCANSISARG